jgi:hypothetical protein
MEKENKLKVSEESFQRTVIDLATRLGWLVHAERKAQSKKGWRTPIQGDKGFPDIVFVHKIRKSIIVAELKSNTGVTSLEQKIWIKRLRESGIEIYIWKPKDFEFIKERLSR